MYLQALPHPASLPKGSKQHPLLRCTQTPGHLWELQLALSLTQSLQAALSLWQQAAAAYWQAGL